MRRHIKCKFHTIEHEDRLPCPIESLFIGNRKLSCKLQGRTSYYHRKPTIHSYDLRQLLLMTQQKSMNKRINSYLRHIVKQLCCIDILFFSLGTFSLSDGKLMYFSQKNLNNQPQACSTKFTKKTKQSKENKQKCEENKDERKLQINIFLKRQNHMFMCPSRYNKQKLSRIFKNIKKIENQNCLT